MPVHDRQNTQIIEELTKTISSDIFDKDYSRDELIIKFTKSMTELTVKLAKKYQMPLFVFIDELDRCRPNFAIDIIECVKHIFEIDNIYFVFGTDGRQLRASVKSQYGEDFESEVYFKRIFQREFQLPEPDYYQFSEMLFIRLGLDRLDSAIFAIPSLLYSERQEQHQSNVYAIALLARHFKLTLRDLEQCLTILASLLVMRSCMTHITFAFFLIVFWYKDKKMFKSYCNSESKYKYFSDNFLTRYVDSTVKINRKVYDQQHGGSKSESIAVVNSYSKYIKLHSCTVNELQNHQHKSNTNFDDQIITLLGREHNRIVVGAAPESLSINSYPNLISQLVH